MRTCDLKEVTGKELKKWWEWLVREQAGCCSVHFASTEKYRYCVCMGWQSGYGPASEEKWFGKDGRLRPAFCPPVTPKEADDGWRICWKIGRQTHNNIMQCDYDVDFEMPYVTEAMAKADPELVRGRRRRHERGRRPQVGQGRHEGTERAHRVDEARRARGLPLVGGLRQVRAAHRAARVAGLEGQR